MGVPYGEEEFADAEREMGRLVEDSLARRQARPGVLFAALSEVTKALSGGAIRWSRKSSIWPMRLGLACCSLELSDFASPRLDAERGGYAPFRDTPRQSDVMVVAGWVTKSMAPEIKRLYEQMPKPKYVIAYGECAASGGPWWESYNIVKGVDQILPVDVYVAGCPPRPENLFAAFVKLQKKIGGEIED
jgi:NADH-quinone oxidoreductase subunit B